MKEKVKLYNVLFPIFIIIWVPSWLWLILIPANYIIDYLVTRLGLKRQSVENYKEIAKKHTWKICLIGFLADFVGSLFMLGIYILDTVLELSDDFEYALMYDPFGNIFALLVVILAIVIAGLIIYFLDYVVLKKINGVSRESAKKAALYLAVITAPYLFLIPSKILYL